MRLRYENRRNLVPCPARCGCACAPGGPPRRCEAPGCPRFHVPFRPEAEGAPSAVAARVRPNVIALIGLLRHRGHRSVPNLLDRYDELLATA
jgi:hypothetical protein